MLSEIFAENRFCYFRKLSIAISLVALITIITLLFKHPLGWQQGGFLIFFSVLTTVLLAIPTRPFAVRYLLSTLIFVIAWRLAALAQYNIVILIYWPLALIKLLNFAIVAYQNITQARANTNQHMLHQLTVFEWQLLFIRMMIGLILVPHFCEKLLAGPEVRQHLFVSFYQMGMPHYQLFVFIAGFIEMAAAFAISCGFLTRLASIGVVTYIMTASVIGEHFQKGFIWASPGGGWEYPVIWSILLLSFACFGAGDFSIDRYLKTRFELPNWIKHLMGGRTC